MSSEKQIYLFRTNASAQDTQSLIEYLRITYCQLRFTVVVINNMHDAGFAKLEAEYSNYVCHFYRPHMTFRHADKQALLEWKRIFGILGLSGGEKEFVNFQDNLGIFRAANFLKS